MNGATGENGNNLFRCHGGRDGGYSRLLFSQLPNPLIHRGFPNIHCLSSGGKGLMLIEYKPGSFEAELGAKIASVTSGHNVTCF